MIRDFWGIRKNTLKEEIDSLQDKIDAGLWKAIHAVRSVGNIGAHMEKDVNFIVDVEPEEAQKLIRLIELLLYEWYVRRDDRARRVKDVIDLAQAKEDAKTAREADAQ